jgi:hypothetical protein
VNFDLIRLANWKTHLAFFKGEERQYKESAALCIAALKHVGKYWPETQKQSKKALIKAAFKLWRLWKKTDGGLLPYKPFDDELNPKSFDYNLHNAPPILKPGRFHHVIENELNSPRFRDVLIKAYHCLFRCGLFLGILFREQMVLTLVEESTALIKVGYYDPCQWAQICYYFAFGSSWALVKVSNALFRKARWLDTHKDLGADVHSMHHVGGLIYYIKAEPKTAIPLIHNFTKYFKERGNLNNELSEYTSMY